MVRSRTIRGAIRPSKGALGGGGGCVGEICVVFDILTFHWN